MTDSAVKEFLSKWKGKGEMPIVFSYKGAERTAVNIVPKNGMVYADYKDSNKNIRVCVNIADLRLLPVGKEDFELPFQKPQLKVGDYVKINTHLKKADYMCGITDRMREYNGDIAKIKSINKRGFYTLEINAGVSSDYLWTDRWITHLTKKQYDDEVIMKPIHLILKSYLIKRGQDIENLSEQQRDAGMHFARLNRELVLALEKRNRSDTEIMDEKKESLLKDIEMLRKDSRISDVAIRGNEFIITTKPIRLTCVNQPMLEDFAYMPSYKISMNFSDCRTRTSYANKDELEKMGLNRLSNCHPHMSTDGNACLGNLAPYFQQAMSGFRIREAVIIIIELLQSYNSGNPYAHLSQYYIKAPKCTHCNQTNVFVTCEHCGYKQDFKDKPILKPFKK